MHEDAPTTPHARFPGGGNEAHDQQQVVIAIPGLALELKGGEGRPLRQERALSLENSPVRSHLTDPQSTATLPRAVTRCLPPTMGLMPSGHTWEALRKA